VPGSSGTVLFDFDDSSSQATISDTENGVKLTLSAFLDKEGVNGVMDSGDTAANVVVNDDSNRGISVDNRSWSNSGNGSNDTRYIENNSQSGNSSDGAYGEKLVLDFSANAAERRHITEVGLTLNQFGDRKADGWFDSYAEEDRVLITVFYIDKVTAAITSVDYSYTADSRSWWDGSNGDSGSKDITITTVA